VATEIRTGGRRRGSFIEEARRAQIGTAAIETVAEFGYGNASLARIADRAGISKSVISYHFDGKGDLLNQVVTEFFADTWEYMSERLDAQTTYMGRVRVWVESQLAYFGAHRSAFLAVIDIVVNHRNPDGSRPFADAEKEEVVALTEMLDAGQVFGEFRPLHSSSVAVVIVQCVDGALTRWIESDDNDLAAQSAALVDFIEHAIRKDTL